MAQTQNYANHAKLVPLFHFVIVPLLTINLGWSIYRAAHRFSADTFIALLLAIALVLLAFHARLFALHVQDRVIRLEMKIRMQRLLPPDLQTRIHQFTVNQLIALRFASAAEVPELARKVLNENIDDRKKSSR
jgi:dolichyl-phosphate-mannose--protein O-mannosyl transferase